MKKLCLCAILLTLSFNGSAQMQEPENLGLSTGRLNRINAFMEHRIDSGHISGGVTLVARHGEIAHLQAHGVSDMASGQPMQDDTMFRLASMSKPVAALAVLMLLEEGRIRLTDTVESYIPAFSNLTVFVPGTNGEETEPAVRPVTIRDLLTHSSGVMSGMFSNIQAAEAAATQQEEGLEWVEALGEIPLEFQPGSTWAYSAVAGFDILSRIVEIASGMTFEEYLVENVFIPLGIQDDITFWPDNAQRDRLAGSYVAGADGLVPRPNPDSMSGEHYFSGAGGLMGSAQAYAKIAMALSLDGSFGDTRLLGVKAVELMRSPVLSHEFVPDTPTLIKPGEGFGLGVKVVEDPLLTNSLLSEGSFGWIGLYGCYVMISPKDELVGIMLVQTFQPGMIEDFETAVMQAIVE